MKVQNYPAMVAYIVNLILSAVVAFNFMSPAVAHTVATVVAAGTALVVAFTVHPFMVAAATGAFQAFVVALAGFGFRLSDQRLSVVVAIFGFVVAIVTHHSVTTLAAHRKGTSVYAIESAANLRVPVGKR